MKRECVGKRAQVTIFVIIAIVVVVIIAGIFLLRNGVGNIFGGQTSDLNQPVETCLNDVALQQLYYIGLQGGYYKTPSPKFNYSIFEVPVYYNKGASSLPTETVLANQLAQAIKDNLDMCGSQIKEKLGSSYNISLSENKDVKVSFNEKNIQVNLNWPITLTTEKSSSTYYNFKTTVNFNFKEKYSNMADFIKEQQKYPTQLLLTQMANFSGSKGFVIEGQILENTTDTMYSFIYENQTYKNQTYVNSFVAIY